MALLNRDDLKSGDQVYRILRGNERRPFRIKAICNGKLQASFVGGGSAKIDISEAVNRGIVKDR